MVKAAPNIYRKHITLDANNQPILYVKLQKALCGCLRSALLFYEKLVRDLMSQGFDINQYDPCVANKLVNGEQFKPTWHVNDIKMSHKDSNEVTKVIVKLPQPQLRTRTYTQTGQSTLRATQARAALSHAYAVTYQNRITDKP
jgi:hypothetical protein